MKILQDQKVYDLLTHVDEQLAQKAYEEGCQHCGGRLHHGDYDRKPRGGPSWSKRRSFTCSLEGCRKRKTPPSVRFLGRKVYAGLVVVLISAMMHGASPSRVEQLRLPLGIDVRTLRHWRVWWRSAFAPSPYWKAERSRFMPPLETEQLPWDLVEAFKATEESGLVRLLMFLAPITTGSCPQGGVM
jgi:hypothetical protein